jgi:hypothetical protein
VPLRRRRWSSGNCCCNGRGRLISWPSLAHKAGHGRADEEALIRLLLEREIRTPTADDAVCSRYDDRHQTRFRSPDLFEPAHILFKARRDDAVADSGPVTQAEAVVGERFVMRMPLSIPAGSQSAQSSSRYACASGTHASGRSVPAGRLRQTGALAGSDKIRVPSPPETRAVRCGDAIEAIPFMPGAIASRQGTAHGRRGRQCSRDTKSPS